MQEFQTNNFVHKLNEWFKFSDTLLPFKQVRVAIQENTEEKFLLAVQKIFSSPNFQKEYFQPSVEPDQIVSGEKIFKEVEKLFKKNKNSIEWELIKAQLKDSDSELKFFSPIENLNNSSAKLWNICQENPKNYQVIAQEIVEETVNNKRVYKKLVFILIGGVLFCFVYFLFWVYLYRSGRLGKIFESLKSLFSVSKITELVTEIPSSSDLEKTEDLLAKVQYFLIKELENDKLINILPADIYDVCLEADKFENPDKFVACIYELFTKLIVKYSSGKEFDSCTKSAIDRYSQFVVQICKSGSSECSKELLQRGLQNVYEICLESLIKKVHVLKFAEKSAKLAKNYRNKYMCSYNKLKKSGKTWLDPED